LNPAHKNLLQDNFRYTPLTNKTVPATASTIASRTLSLRSMLQPPEKQKKHH
jgi:hypothetical protein